MKSESAQITIDYIAGIGIFLLSVFFVFQFVSGLFIPFQSGSDKAALAADRAGTVLVEQMLQADTSRALNVIDQGKLYYFSNTQLNYSNQTAYNNALSALGLSSKQTVFDLNISVANCSPSFFEGVPIANNLTCPNTPSNQSGPPLPDNTDTAQTKRLVLIVNSTNGNQTYSILSVRVW